MEISTTTLWPSYLWSVKLETVENDKLIKFINEDYKENPNIFEKSNRNGGWQSDIGMHNKEVFKPLGKETAKIIYTIFPKSKGINILDMWSCINFKNSFNTPHDHMGAADISGAYYLKVPKDSGEIYFTDPRPSSSSSFYLRSVVDKGSKRIIKPFEGLLLLWPSFLIHGTFPNLSNDTRIMVSFNLKVL